MNSGFQRSSRRASGPIPRGHWGNGLQDDGMKSGYYGNDENDKGKTDRRGRVGG